MGNESMKGMDGEQDVEEISPAVQVTKYHQFTIQRKNGTSEINQGDLEGNHPGDYQKETTKDTSDQSSNKKAHLHPYTTHLNHY